MIKNAFTPLFALALAACGSAGSPEPASPESGSSGGEEHAALEQDAPEPIRVLEDGSRLFGAEISTEGDVTPLAEIVASPERFAGQVVKTEGEIAQVCQAMGCWMELRTDAESPGVRVPMANHAFFLPRDVVGSHATIEGTVRVDPLSAERREHLESEGATATTEDLSIDATSVLVR